MLSRIFKKLFPCEFDKQKCKESMLGCKCGQKDKKPEKPQFREDPGTTALKNKLLSQTSSILETPYEDYVSRFTPSQKVQDIRGGVLDKYQGLLETEDYGLESFEGVESQYLENILGRYKETRGEQFESIRERLISENLYESGPGFGQEREFAEETAKGVGDISTQFAYEGIDRRFKERSYKDALKRGDYTTMFNLALSEAEAEIAPAREATRAQTQGIAPAAGLFGDIQSGELSRFGTEAGLYSAELDYKAQQDASRRKMIGTLVGVGGVLAAPFTGGASLALTAGAAGAAGAGKPPP